MHTNTAHSFSLWSWLFFLSYTQHIWNEKKKTIQSVQKRELQKKVTYGKTWRKKQARMKFEYGEWVLTQVHLLCNILLNDNYRFSNRISIACRSFDGMILPAVTFHLYILSSLQMCKCSFHRIFELVDTIWRSFVNNLIGLSFLISCWFDSNINSEVRLRIQRIYR